MKRLANLEGDVISPQRIIVIRDTDDSSKSLYETYYDINLLYLL